MQHIDRIASFVTTELAKGRGRAAVGFDEDLLELGLLDSISLVRLVAHLETSFEIEVLDEDLLPENFQTIASISAYVERRLAARGAALATGAL